MEDGICIAFTRYKKKWVRLLSLSLIQKIVAVVIMEDGSSGEMGSARLRVSVILESQARTHRILTRLQMRSLAVEVRVVVVLVMNTVEGKSINASRFQLWRRQGVVVISMER